MLTIFFLCLVVVGFQLSIYNGFHISGYYSAEVALAQEEKTIGETLLTRHAPQFYIYATTPLGSIMYYSRLIMPGYLSSTTPHGIYLLYQTPELQKLETAYPALHLVPLYQGTYLSLAIAD